MQQYIDLLTSRKLDDGGFATRPGGAYRCDVSAWATLTLRTLGVAAEALQASRVRLARDQLDDGRVPLHREHDYAVWPTPLCILAWSSSDAFASNVQRAADFLLAHQGEVPWDLGSSPFGHDLSLIGWPWALGTVSWVEPTALCMMALRAVGKEDHPRLAEATRLLLDRMLPEGGWNYGNTTVYGKVLEPLPVTTGAALCALAGRVKRKQVASSLGYLANELHALRTPLSLGWSLLGLSSWQEYPETAKEKVAEVFAGDTTGFETDQLAILILADSLERGSLALYSGELA